MCLNRCFTDIAATNAFLVAADSPVACPFLVPAGWCPLIRSRDRDTKQYVVGIDLEWDFDVRELFCSMGEYIETALPKQHHYSPSKAITPENGSRVQYIEDDDSCILTPEEIKRIQKVGGKFLISGNSNQ